MSLTYAQAVAKVNQIFAAYGSATSLVSGKWTAGKVYEAWILGHLLTHLEQLEGYQVMLIGGSNVHLKSSPGPINPGYPRFRITKKGRPSLDVWTDIEFTTLSYEDAGRPVIPGRHAKPPKAFRHELDIVVVEVGTRGYPSHGEVIIGVECKNTGFSKAMARAALGVRRELSLLSYDMTGFAKWPRIDVPAAPPSVFLVFSTDPDVVAYNAAGQTFGVDFYHEPVP